MAQPTKLPSGTTQEQWDRYELDQKNHEARINGRREYLEAILTMVQKHGIEYTQDHFNRELDKSLHMDAPNKPGYYRSNND